MICLNGMNKAKRFANQQRSNVDIAGVYCFCLRAIKAVEEKSTTSYIGQLLTAADHCKKQSGFEKLINFSCLFFYLGKAVKKGGKVGVGVARPRFSWIVGYD